jgi:ABC-type amino acid transport substrate-binding protein
VRARWLAVYLTCAAGSCVAAGWPGPSTPVRFAPERDYGPFVFERADGRLDGLSVEMLQLVQGQAGLSIVTLPARPLQQQLDALRAHEADLVSSLRPTPQRAAFLNFSIPYVSVPAVVVTREGQPSRPLSTLAGRPVGVGQGYAVEAVVRARHPEVDWRALPDDEKALRAVIDGRLDAAVVDTASLAHVMRESRLAGLRVSAPADFEYALSFAVRKDWPELRDALDAALRAIPAAQKQALVERWIGATPIPGAAGRTPWADRIAWGLLGLAALGAAFFAAQNARQRRSAPP